MANAAARPPIAPLDDNRPDAARALDQGQGEPIVEQSLATDKLPIDQLAHMDYDRTVFFLSTAPLWSAALILIVFIGLVYYRRAKQWNEIGPAMRLDDDVQPETPQPKSQFATAELAALEGHDNPASFQEKRPHHH